MADSSIQLFRSALPENGAKSLEQFDDAQSLYAGNATRQRVWALTTTANCRKLLDCLNLYTSAKNAKPQVYVVNPMCDGETWDGTFRQVEAKRLRVKGRTLISQTLKRVYLPNTFAELAVLNYRKSNENEILAPFGYGPGEGDKLACIFNDINPAAESKCMGFSDANLASLPGSGWTYVDRLFTLNQDNTATFTVILRKITWSAFSVAAPDITVYQDKTTEKEKKTEIWIGINKDDALTGLYTTVPSKYNAIAANISEVGEGAINITRTLLKETYGASAAEIEELETDTLNPLGLEVASYARVTIINENLKLKTSAYGTLAAADSGYTLIGYKENLGDNGLWNKYYIYAKVTWTNWDTENTAPARIVQTGVSNPGGFGEGKSEQATGVPVANAESAIAHLAADNDYTLRNLQWQERGNGEAAFRFDQQRTFDYGSAGTVTAPTLIRTRNYLHGQTAAAYFVWHRVAADRIDAVETAAKLIANYTTWFTGQYAAGDGWKVSEVWKDEDGDGAADVFAEVKIPETSNTTLESWYWTQSGAAPTVVWQYIRDSDGVIIRQIELYILWAARYSAENIIAWLTSLSGNDLLNISDWTRIGEYKYLGKAVWINSETPGPP